MKPLMRYKYFTWIFILSLFISLTVQGCSNSSSDKGRETIKMTDDPANFDAMIVNINRIEAHKSGSGANGWELISDQPTQVNLLSLTNGQASVLGSNQLDAGNYDQIRLVLGSGNKIVDNGVTYALSIPSSLQTGIKINVDMQVKGGSSNTLLLDFNAAESVALSGVGIYILHPVIRPVNTNTDGNIKGSITPDTLHTYVVATGQTDTASTYADTTSGAFKIMGLHAGTYNVHFYVGSRAYQDTTISNVEVNAGDDTDMGKVTIKPAMN